MCGGGWWLLSLLTMLLSSIILSFTHTVIEISFILREKKTSLFIHWEGFSWSWLTILSCTTYMPALFYDGSCSQACPGNEATYTLNPLVHNRCMWGHSLLFYVSYGSGLWVVREDPRSPYGRGAGHVGPCSWTHRHVSRKLKEKFPSLQFSYSKCWKLGMRGLVY